MSSRKIRESPIVRENHLDFLHDLYKKGVYLKQEDILLLTEAGYIGQKKEPKQIQEAFRDNVNLANLSMDTKNTRKADALIDIVESAEVENEILTSQEMEDRRKKYGHIFEGRTEPIKTSEWMPKSIIYHTPEFVNWINSINKKGFTNKSYYRPFALYCQQAYQWLQEQKTSEDFDDLDERSEFRQNELRRCDDNSLYFLNKYIWYKEGDAEDETGKIKYIAAPPHEVLAFLHDTGYSLGLAKGRQQAATTTIMALQCKDVCFKLNHFMKFITEDDEKAVEIFEDKLKFPFSELPEWMRPNVLNERDNMFKIGYKSEKGKKEGVGSKIQITVPKRTAIAGGAPNRVIVDEAGNIPILGIMIGNSRPTMYFHEKRTGKIKLKRKLWYLGTGGEQDKGGKAFETELMTLMRRWDEGNFEDGIVPLFFDWRCRPGATQEDYDREKSSYYAKAENQQDPNSKRFITEFHQTWPNNISDVFRTSSKTLFDDDYTESAIQRINEARNSAPGVQLTHHGYFEPIYDTTKPTSEGSDVPYKIIGAEFIPTEDLSPLATVTIFLHPQKDWTNRYYQGTDPIDTNSGQSDFASAIWDKHLKTFSAVLHFRVADYEQVFLQSMLMGLYYDTKNEYGVPELVESNRGTSYTQYKKQKGFVKNMVINKELPELLVNNSTINDGVGVDNKGQRNTVLVHTTTQLYSYYGNKIYLSIFFEQLKTFTCTVSAGGKEVWGPVNRKYYKDDTIWAGTFAYICGELVYTNKKPENITVAKNSYKIVSKLERDENTLKFRRVNKKVPLR